MWYVRPTNPHYPWVYLCGRKGPNCRGKHRYTHTHIYSTVDRRTIAMHNRSKYIFNSVCSQTQGVVSNRPDCWGGPWPKYLLPSKLNQPTLNGKVTWLAGKPIMNVDLKMYCLPFSLMKMKTFTAMFAYQRTPPPGLRVATHPTETDELNWLRWHHFRTLRRVPFPLHVQ